MKLYGYYNDNGEIKQAEIEVKEKIVLVPLKDGDSFPFLYENSIERDKIGELIGWNGTIFYREPSFERAKEKFLEKARKEYSSCQNESNMKGAIVARLEKQADVRTYGEFLKEQHDERVLKTPDPVQLTIEQLKKSNIL